MKTPPPTDNLAPVKPFRDFLAHPITIAELHGKVRVDRALNEGDMLELGSGRSAQILFTPGHARGHIVLWEAAAATLVLGDMVAGIGSVLISAPDGAVATYLHSLERLRSLNGLAANAPLNPGQKVKLVVYGNRRP